MLNVPGSETGLDKDDKGTQPTDRRGEPPPAAVNSEGRLRSGIQTEGGFAAIEEFLERPLTIPISS